MRRLVVIHASPPCQAYSVTRTINSYADTYPKLIEPLRERLREIGLPYVIENVEGAKKEMISPATLCGSQFGLRAEFNGENAYLRRHRCFETNWALSDDDAGPHDHSGYASPVFGHGPGGTKKQNPHLRGPGGAALAQRLMQIDWMTRRELNQSIPPAYTEYIGKMIINQVENIGPARPLLIDLFCGAGGASKGYHDAGFEVIGIDIEPMPRYPYTFIQADAIEFLEWLLAKFDFLACSGLSGVIVATPLHSYELDHKTPLQRGGVKPYPHRENLDLAA